MTEYQNNLLTLMKRVDAFLRANNIRYYLLGGSMIGAMRHKGYIPWDDDFDIMIGRKDFNRLVEMSGDLGVDDLEFDCFENDPYFSKPYGMFSRTNDTCTSSSRIFWGGKCMGTAIDVFVLDDMNSRDKEEFIHALLLHQEVMSKVKIYKDEIIRYKDEYLEYKDREKKEGKAAIVKELRDNLISFASGECDTRVVTTWGMKLRDYPYEWIDEPKLVPYEDAMFPVPTKPEACLRLQYGYNWYMIPETTEQVEHNFYQNDSLSYNNYYADIDHFIDWDEAYAVLDERKRIKVDTLEANKNKAKFHNEIAANAALMRYEEIAESERIAMAESGRHVEFLESMEQLFVKRNWFTTAGISNAISDEIAIIWISELVYAGRYFDAMKVRSIFLSKEAAGSSNDTLKLLDKVITLAEVYQDHDMDGIKAALGAIPEEAQNHLPDCILAKGRLLDGDYTDKKAIGDLITVCREHLNDYPNNYDIQKMLGDLLWETGDKDEAMDLYKVVNDKSRNGLDLLDLSERFGMTAGYLSSIISAEDDDEEEDEE